MDQTQTSPQHVPEKYLIAFVIQGEDVFKITADNVIHTIGTADGPAFDAIAKLKAAAALLELTNRHKERPDELRKMARELAGEGMKLMARASSSIRPVPAPIPSPLIPSPETQPDATYAEAGREAADDAAQFFGQTNQSSEQEALVEETVPALRVPVPPSPVQCPQEFRSASAPTPISPRIALISS